MVNHKDSIDKIYYLLYNFSAWDFPKPVFSVEKDATLQQEI